MQKPVVVVEYEPPADEDDIALDALDGLEVLHEEGFGALRTEVLLHFRILVQQRFDLFQDD